MKLLCITQFQFFYVLVSIHDSFFNALQGRNQTISQPDASMHPNMYFFVSKMLSITNRPCLMLYTILPKSIYYKKA